jgi:hypothetical protein
MIMKSPVTRCLTINHATSRAGSENWKPAVNSMSPRCIPKTRGRPAAFMQKHPDGNITCRASSLPLNNNIDRSFSCAEVLLKRTGVMIHKRQGLGGATHANETRVSAPVPCSSSGAKATIIDYPPAAKCSFIWACGGCSESDTLTTILF